MTSSNPYDVAPILPRGDTEDSELFEAVGRALTQWEMLEGSLGKIFAGLCGGLGEGAERAYGVVSSFSGRHEMLGEAFAVFRYRSDPKVSGLPNLLKRTKLFSPRRNEIAHGVVTSVEGEKENLGHYLCPAHYNSRKRPTWDQVFEALDARSTSLMLGKYAYTAAQIDQYRQHFFDLNTEAVQIHIALSFKQLDDQGRGALG